MHLRQKYWAMLGRTTESAQHHRSASVRMHFQGRSRCLPSRRQGCRSSHRERLRNGGCLRAAPGLRVDQLVDCPTSRAQEPPHVCRRTHTIGVCFHPPKGSGRPGRRLDLRSLSGSASESAGSQAFCPTIFNLSSRPKQLLSYVSSSALLTSKPPHWQATRSTVQLRLCP